MYHRKLKVLPEHRGHLPLFSKKAPFHRRDRKRYKPHRSRLHHSNFFPYAHSPFSFPFEDGVEHQGGKVIGFNCFQATHVPPNRGSDGTDNNDFFHVVLPDKHTGLPQFFHLKRNIGNFHDFPSLRQAGFHGGQGMGQDGVHKNGAARGGKGFKDLVLKRFICVAYITGGVRQKPSQ